jgi:iron(III) transport system substrate-binding protein
MKAVRKRSQLNMRPLEHITITKRILEEDMKKLNPALRAAALSVALFAAHAAHAQVPAGYPGSYQSVIDGAKKEGKVLVYSVTDTALVRPLIKDFESLYGVKVEYNDMNSTELYTR